MREMPVSDLGGEIKIKIRIRIRIFEYYQNVDKNI